MSCPAHDLAKSRRMLALEDVDLIREVVASLPAAALVVDVGAGSGTTALAVFAERRDIQLTSIEADIDTMNWARQAVENIGASEGWNDIVRDAIEAAQGIADGAVSFIILDAGHTDRAVTAQLQAWLPKLAPHGFLLVHDYDARDAPNYYPGVKTAVDRFIAKDELQRVRQQGWSLLAQSTYGEEPIRQLPLGDASKPKQRHRRKKAMED